MQYHVSRNGQQFGPYEEGDLGAMILSGNVMPDDTVWAAGMAGWQPAAQVFPHLFRQPVAPGRSAPVSNVKVVGRPQGPVAGARPGQTVVQQARVRAPHAPAHGHGYPQEAYGMMPQRSRPPAGAGAWMGAIFVDLIIILMCLGPAWFGINKAVSTKGEESRKAAQVAIEKGLKPPKVLDSNELYSQEISNFMDHQPTTWISIGLLSMVVVGNVAFLAIKGRTIAGSLLNI